MSLPSFLSSPSFLSNTTASANSSPLAASSSAAANPRAGGGDFRQTFKEMTGTSKTETSTSSTDKGGTAAVVSNEAGKSAVLSADDQQTLQSAFADGDLSAAELLQLPLSPEVRQILTDALQQADLDLPSLEEQSLEEQFLSMESVVDLLAGGKMLPLDEFNGAINLAETDMAGETADDPLWLPGTRPAVAFHTFAEAEPEPADLPLLAGQGKRLDLNPWLTAATNAEESGESALPLTTKTSAGSAELLTSKAEIFSSLLVAPETESNATGLTSPTIADSKPGAVAQLPPAPLNPAMRMQVAFGHAQWSEALAERAAWLAGQQIHSAELQLDPPELGPLQVRISVHQDQAVVSFVSANPQVRDALDQSMARLRELMQEQGMQLVDAGVSDQHREDSGEATAEGALPPDGDGDEAVEVAHTSAPIVTRYGVDDFV